MGKSVTYGWLRPVSRRSPGRLGKRGPIVRAHRHAWELVHGPIESSEWVCHRCHNGLCINPRHLYIGTPQSNVDDMIFAGRQNLSGLVSTPRGRGIAYQGAYNPLESRRQGPRCPLSREQIAEIRLRRSRGETLATLADAFGIAPSTVWRYC